MNIRIIALLIGFAALPTLAQAADRAARPADTERAAVLQKLSRGASLTSNGQEYQLLPGVRAAKSQPREQPQQTLTRMGGGKLIESKGSFVVFTEAQQSAASVTSVNGISYPAVVNPRTGGIGIVPGTLNVKLKNNASAAAVASNYGLEVVREFAHLKTVFYRVKTGQDVLAAAASLAADARVESAEVEVIEHLNVPH